MWERNFDQLSPVYTPTKDQTYNLGLCPGLESNLQPFSEGDNTPTEPPGQGYSTPFAIIYNLPHFSLQPLLTQGGKNPFYSKFYNYFL